MAKTVCGGLEQPHQDKTKLSAFLSERGKEHTPHGKQRTNLPRTARLLTRLFVRTELVRAALSGWRYYSMFAMRGQPREESRIFLYERQKELYNTIDSFK